jgi:DHA1 family bicyclomycin/chloramphenicol resistance-like MFS transporter
MVNYFMKQFLLLATVILMDLLTGMEFDLFVPSFPEIQTFFGLSAFWVEACLSVNYIAYCISLFVVGDLADRYGRRPVILLGLVLFAIGSIFCLVADGYGLFLTGRFLQGAGVAAPSILSFLLIADLFPIQKQQFYLAMLNGVMNVAVACAPVMGSYIALYFGWQGNFMTLFLLGLVVLAMSLLFVPKYSHQRQDVQVSYFQILQSKPVMLMAGHNMIQYAPYWVFAGIAPLLYMEHMNVSLAEYGYYQGSLALIFAIGCVIYGLVMKRYDQKKALHFSNLLFLVGLIATIGLCSFDSSSPLLITLTIMVFVVGQIIPTTLIFPMSLNYLPGAKGRVSAITMGGKLILSSLGLQLAGYYYNGTFFHLGVILAVMMVLTVVTLIMVIAKAFPSSTRAEALSPTP